MTLLLALSVSKPHHAEIPADDELRAADGRRPTDSRGGAAMDFLHFDMGHASAGDVVVVSLDHEARVQLLDNQNLELYRHGRDFRAVRVWAKESPAQLRVPHAGHWHVAVDLGGRAGRIGAEVDLVRAA